MQVFIEWNEVKQDLASGPQNINAYVLRFMNFYLAESRRHDCDPRYPISLQKFSKNRSMLVLNELMTSQWYVFNNRQAYQVVIESDCCSTRGWPAEVMKMCCELLWSNVLSQQLLFSGRSSIGYALSVHFAAVMAYSSLWGFATVLFLSSAIGLCHPYVYAYVLASDVSINRFTWLG